MENLQEYILRICAVGIICSIALTLLGDKGTVSAVVKLVTGLVLTLTVAAPLTQFRIGQISDYLDGLQFQASEFSQIGQTIAREEMAAVIKSKVEEYIRDEAAALGADLEVSATVSLNDDFQISSITLQGAVSPLHRQKLQQIMAQDLGVSKEHQIWKN